MTTYPTDIHGPAATAPAVTHRYAVCEVCGCQWQVRSEVDADAQGCSFCNAAADQVSVRSEAPGYQGSVIR